MSTVRLHYGKKVFAIRLTIRLPLTFPLLKTNILTHFISITSFNAKKYAFDIKQSQFQSKTRLGMYSNLHWGRLNMSQDLSGYYGRSILDPLPTPCHYEGTERWNIEERNVRGHGALIFCSSISRFVR
jgi:hypothetical protein